MSLTNPRSVVTEQRLSAFYQGILPYMGGMPEMLANKFSKGDLYSTEEKMIGQWIDGKPLYQKVFSVVDTGNSSTHTITIPSTLNIESVVYFKAEKVCEGYGISIPYTESNHVITVSKPVTSGDIVFTKDTATVWSGTYYLTMKYTKTTDSAISIGSDTDYSTEEKIIGTWIDGSPVYQKVVYNTTLGTIPNNSWVQYCTITNLKAVISFSLIRASSDGTPSNGVFNDISGSTDGNSVKCIARASTLTLDNSKSYAIIQYTKTTD